MTVLDNPIWHALRTRHAALGDSDAMAAAYHPDVAPFVGVANADAPCGEALAARLGERDTYYLVGVIPPQVPGWELHDHGVIDQMICASAPDAPPGPDAIELGAAHLDDMLALTGLVYPGYFRRETPRMGRYLGIYVDGRLAAMAGERMDLPGHREISGVCTHPDHLGKGYAQRLVALVTRDIFAAGLQPFLHVSAANVRAKRVYEHLGFADRAALAHYVLQR
ncbi:MAG TPA: GNAT family N-acetyltransferase [Tahibacter sp.]|uniref:GNAT family N-acetyltransferase n=1 Tax=Tahibacter sp. TaxID=2056211 RepID=UPI002CD1F848|nr:GNAT family N-acetyltransferase [Tahibacter sp.]HSX61351.1 GNAT family N-acetyltransferase [Tahibacter sp.]